MCVVEDPQPHSEGSPHRGPRLTPPRQGQRPRSSQLVTSGGGCSKTRSVIAAAAVTRPTGSADCCCGRGANLNDRGWERLRDGLAAGDPDGHVAAVWLARELLSEVYTARDPAHA